MKTARPLLRLKQVYVMVSILLIFLCPVSSAATKFKIYPKKPATQPKPRASDSTYDDKVQVLWVRVSTVKYYKVFRCTTVSTKSCLTSFNANGASYSDTTATPEVKYYYRIKACNIAGCSGFSGADTGQRMLAAPAIPSGVNASDRTYTNKIRIGWNRVVAALKYRIFRCDNTNANSCNTSFMDNSPPFDDSRSPAGQTYHYRVQSCNSSKCSNFSSSDSGKRKLKASKPYASDNTFTDKVAISWSESYSATSYTIFRCIGGVSNSCGNGIGTATNLTFYDLNAVPGNTYFYRIKACTTEGCSDFSPADSGMRRAPPAPPAPPTAPLRPYVAGVRANYILINWSEVTRATFYKIIRCGNSSIGVCFEKGQTERPPYNDSSVQLNRTYYYRIEACNTVGCSASSPSASGRITAQIPSTPSKPTIPITSFTGWVRLNWSTVSGVTSSGVYRCSSSLTSSCKKIFKSTSLSFDDTDALPNTNYYYRIKACNTAGCSNLSPAVIGVRKQ